MTRSDGIRNRRLCALASSLLLATMSSPAAAEVSVTIGPTAIPRGDALGARDITVSNGRFAVAFAVDSAPPWGVARGGIVDIAILDAGVPGYDFASLADFMPNNWSSWPGTYQRVSVETASPGEAVIRTLRDWGEVELETLFRIRDGDSRIHMSTRMHNRGRKALEDLSSGYVVWPDGGALLAEPIVTSRDEVRTAGGWTAAYDRDWLLGLHAPFSEIALRRGRDRYTRHSLRPGESRTFEAWLQIEPSGDLAPMLRSEIEMGELPSGRLHGSVRSSDGESVAAPAVVVARGGFDFAWTIGADGQYTLDLPVGDYDVYATAAAHAKGRSRRVTIGKGDCVRLDFDDLGPPAALQLQVSDADSGRPLDARISIAEGYTPAIAYFGKSTLFTELRAIGSTSEAIAPGSYRLLVSAAGGFLSLPTEVAFDLAPGESRTLDVTVEMLASPAAHGWYNADLHHHSDVLDGFTDAEYVMRAQLAAGVDLAFLSDHDSVVNNAAMQRLAETRGLPFIAGTELSPSWGHFNAYPLPADAEISVDTGSAAVQEIFESARDYGADVVAVNHPYSDYGYFTSADAGMVPGGFDAGFDLVEIEPLIDNAGLSARIAQTLQRVFALWNQGQKAYLTAGSDVHDVWAKLTGRSRTFVHVDGELTVGKFIDGLKAGRAYASQGPLIYPEILFGSELLHPAGSELLLRYEVQAVSGLESVQLIEAGRPVARRDFDGAMGPAPVEFSVRPAADTWYSVIVRDRAEGAAYSNPVWVSVQAP